MKERREGEEREERGETDKVGWLAEAGMRGGRRREAALELREVEVEAEEAEGCVSGSVALCRLLAAGEKKSRAACELRRRCDDDAEVGGLDGNRSSCSDTRDSILSMLT